ATAAGVEPLFGAAGGGGEAVVQVDAVGDTLFFRERDHFFGFAHFIGDGFFAERGDAGAEQLHRRGVVVAAVFFARGAHAGGVELEAALEHVGDGVERGRAVGGGGFVGALLEDVADGDELHIG